VPPALALPVAFASAPAIAMMHTMNTRCPLSGSPCSTHYPSTSYTSPSPSTSTISSTSTKAYKDSRGILHDPEWRDFPTEEWRKQRRAREQSSRRGSSDSPHSPSSPSSLRSNSNSNSNSLAAPHRTYSRRPSIEYTDDDSDLEEEYEYSAGSGWRRSPTAGGSSIKSTGGRRRRSEGDASPHSKGLGLEWDVDEEDVEYAFGGRKNRNRMRYRKGPEIKVVAAPMEENSATTMRTGLDLERTRTVLSDLVPTTTNSSSNATTSSTTRSKKSLRSLFKLPIPIPHLPHLPHHHHARDPDASSLGVVGEFDWNYPDVPYYDVTPSSPTAVTTTNAGTSGLGLTGIDPLSPTTVDAYLGYSAYTTGSGLKAPASTPTFALSPSTSPYSLSATLPSHTLSASPPELLRSSFSDSEDEDEDDSHSHSHSPSNSCRLSSKNSKGSKKHSHSLSHLKEKAHRRYLAVELAFTLGVVRTERRWRDWRVGTANGSEGGSKA
jgi:hypothetical protein